MAAKKTTKTQAKKTTSKKRATKTAPKKAKPVAPPAGTNGADQMVSSIATGLTLEEKDERIKALAQSFNKEGARYVVTADEAPNPYFIRRPTGNMELDIHLGGGFPAGGACFISGPDNSGKTWLMLETMAMQQRLYGSATRMAYALAEGAFPYDAAIKAGLRVFVPDEMVEQWQEWRRIRSIPPYTDEQIAYLQDPALKDQIRIITGATGEDILQVVLDCVRINAFSIIAVDSLNGLQPSVDSEKDLTDNEKIAAQATMIGRFFKKYIPLTTGFVGTNHTTVLFTQQVRANQERANAPSYMQKWLPQYVSSGGGYSGKHYKLIGLLLEEGKVLKNSNKDVIGKMMKWYLEKGKAGTHDNLGGEVSFFYERGGIDNIGELLTSGIKRGVIQTRGKQVVIVRPDDKQVIEDFTAPNNSALRKMLEADFAFEMALRREILTSAGIQCLY